MGRAKVMPAMPQMSQGGLSGCFRAAPAKAPCSPAAGQTCQSQSLPHTKRLRRCRRRRGTAGGPGLIACLGRPCGLSGSPAAAAGPLCWHTGRPARLTPWTGSTTRAGTGSGCSEVLAVSPLKHPGSDWWTCSFAPLFVCLTRCCVPVCAGGAQFWCYCCCLHFCA